MAQVNRLSPNVHSVGIGTNHPDLANTLHVAAGGKAGVFSCLAIDVADVTTAAITTWYYWPMTTGHLRYGSTAPTIATQDTAGAEVNT